MKIIFANELLINIILHFGKHIRLLRKEKGLTQEQLSFEIDADNSYIANIENAHRDIPLSRIKKLQKR